MSAATSSLPTGLMPRFSQFINGIKRTIGDIVLYRHEVMPLILPLGAFLTATQRRLTALHARFVAGKLPAAPRAPGAVSDRATVKRPPPEPRPPARRPLAEGVAPEARGPSPGRRAFRRGRCC